MLEGSGVCRRMQKKTMYAPVLDEFGDLCFLSSPENVQKISGLHYTLSSNMLLLKDCKMFVTSGFSKKNWQQCLSLNLNTGVTEPVPSMIIPRQGHVVCEHSGKIFAIGGETMFGKICNSVECFDGSKWRLVASMHEKRYNFAAISFRGSIFVFGGNGRCEQVLNSVEKYDVAIDTWTQMSTVPVRIAQHVAVESNGKIVVFGGYHHHGQHRMFAYFPERDTWQTIVCNNVPWQKIVRENIPLYGNVCNVLMEWTYCDDLYCSNVMPCEKHF